MEARGLELELVEQPVPAADLEGLKFVTDHVHTDILADEAVFGLRDAVRLIRMRAARGLRAAASPCPTRPAWASRASRG